MPGLLSSVAAGENKQLYNAASKWQDEWGSDLPGTYTTFYREYDPVLGRFQAVDPKATLYLGMTPYHYTGNNPVMRNDPLGDYFSAAVWRMIGQAWQDTPDGGYGEFYYEGGELVGSQTTLDYAVIGDRNGNGNIYANFSRGSVVRQIGNLKVKF